MIDILSPCVNRCGGSTRRSIRSNIIWITIPASRYLDNHIIAFIIVSVSDLNYRYIAVPFSVCVLPV